MGSQTIKTEFLMLSCMAVKLTILFESIAGNCCWTIYQRENKRGQLKNLQVGQDWKPTFEPKAYFKVDC